MAGYIFCTRDQANPVMSGSRGVIAGHLPIARFGRTVHTDQTNGVMHGANHRGHDVHEQGSHETGHFIHYPSARLLEAKRTEGTEVWQRRAIEPRPTLTTKENRPPPI